MNASELETIEARLQTGVFRDCRPVWYSSNYVYLARLDCQGDEFLAIYKPRDGESPLWDFPPGTLYRREVAAYCLAKALEWPLVPPTVVRAGPSGVGSLQQFVEHRPHEHFFVQRENADYWPQLQRICLFDAIANNADRKGGHCILDEQRTIWAIDNGLCFNEQYKLRTVIWDWAGERIPDDMLAELAAGVQRLEGETPQAAALRSLLDEREYRATVRRAERLLESARFPVPGAERHYPWPLV
jgi:hypothetical protein